MSSPSSRVGALVAAVFAAVLLAAACGSGDTAIETAAEPAAADDVTDDDMDMADHDHGTAMEVAYEPVPSLSIEVLEDPKSGWNLHVTPADFRLAPEHVSTEPVDGEGHMHLYVDGEKITRIYGEWYYLGVLEPGMRTIRVELSANNHAALAVDGELIDATVMVEVPGLVEVTASSDDDEAAHDHDESSGDDEAAHDHDESSGDDGHQDEDAAALGISAADQIVELGVTAGQVDADQSVAVELGSTVALVVTADVADEVHVHGYDLYLDLVPGEIATLMFEANIPGQFEVELEGASLLLTELEVS